MYSSSATGYSTSAGRTTVANSDAGGGAEQGFWSLDRCKRAYMDYLGSKTAEIEEQKEARRYYHGSQWTEKQIKALKARRQPVVTFNRTQRKIDSVIGLLERMRQDPKAFPRTPNQDDGAELATASIRYVLDEQEWKAKSPEVARDGAIDGVAGVELELIEGDKGDKEVGLNIVEPDSFFYDPRSFREDFSDAMYMGMGKWVDAETAEATWGSEVTAGASYGSGELTTNPDRENKWFSTDGRRRMVRVVDLWYRIKGKWLWTLFTGSTKLSEGESPFFDEKGKTVCRFIMFSASVDQDGDRYGFVRNMKSAQDELNNRRSKALHILNSKRLIITKGAFEDVEQARKEWARPDGVLEVLGDDVTKGARAEDQSFDFAGQLKLLENATAEFENFGPNPALVGTGGVENSSGRAISLLQQAGIAELGPFILGFRGWKIRVYRAIWNTVQRYWTGERWIRVTDNENLAQWIKVNGLGIDPQTNMPTLINALGALDVDIILDEGPDTITMQMANNETLAILAGKGVQVPPQVLIELSDLDSTVKKKIQQMLSQPDPMAEKAKEIALAGEAAKVDETQSKTALNMAKAQEAGMPQAGGQEKYELPPELQHEQAIAEINDRYASADHKRAQARHIDTQAALAPLELVAEHQQRNEDRRSAEKAASKKVDA